MASFLHLPTEIREVILKYAIIPLLPQYLQVSRPRFYLSRIKLDPNLVKLLRVNREFNNSVHKLIFDHVPLALIRPTTLNENTTIISYNRQPLRTVGSRIKHVHISLAENRPEHDHLTTQLLNLFDQIERHIPKLVSIYLTLEVNIYKHKTETLPPAHQSTIEAIACHSLGCKVRRVRFMAKGLDPSPVTQRAWAQFLTNFHVLPMLVDLELLFDFSATNSLESLGSGFMTRCKDTLIPAMKTVVEVLPKTNTIAIWLSRKDRATGQETPRRRLNEVGERSLTKHLASRYVSVHSGLETLTADDCFMGEDRASGRLRRETSKWFDAVLDPAIRKQRT